MSSLAFFYQQLYLTAVAPFLLLRYILSAFTYFVVQLGKKSWSIDQDIIGNNLQENANLILTVQNKAAITIKFKSNDTKVTT